ncbi:F-box protein CPR1-like [Humulus lupulus]|uniref:F-box protein CPR1-like n=1 Tax=Humulus lupulus TaxID=3486 RepID=UPI002B413137|nr:F-box protein CPR1-like [Humulus lupulus]
MANPEKGVVFNNFPCDSLGDVLSRLDAKSLKRCECVSKSWLSLLRTPYFIKLHLQRQLPRVVFLQKKVRKFDHTLSICDCESFAEISSRKFPFNERNYSSPLFMGSDNGVLGLFCFKTDVIHLWNPTINESKELPSFPHSTCNDSVLGLGFDPLTADFKVVRFTSLDENGVVRNDTHNLFKEGNQVWIYSLRSNSWKTMAMPNIFSDFEIPTFDIIITAGVGCSIVFNECIHWMVWFVNRTGYHQSSLGIVSFDISMENFKLLKSPQIVKLERDHGSNLANFSGCLSFFTLNEFQVAEIWVMKKYGDSDSWFKYLSVNLLSLLPNRFGQRCSYIPVGFLSNGILVISCTETDCWYCYDTKSKRLENVGERFGVSDFTTYVESTFKLNG